MNGRTQHRRLRSGLAGVLALVLLGLLPGRAGAEGTPPGDAAAITPAQVQQQTQTLRAEIGLLLEADLVETPPPEVPPMASRQPRHVFQEARAVYQQVQTLRYLNGLPRRKLGPVPVRAIRPRDIYFCVQHILADLRPLRPVYGVSEEVAQPPLRPEANDTRVFRDLLWVQEALRKLGLPIIAPNAPYRDALIALDKAQSLARVFGMPSVSGADASALVAAQSARGTSDTTPDDVYRLGLTILDELWALVRTVPELRLPGDALIPRPLSRTAQPADVRRVLRTLRAELNALKATTGVQTPASYPPVQTGRTPGDVYDVVSAVRAVLTRLGEQVARTAGEAGP